MKDIEYSQSLNQLDAELENFIEGIARKKQTLAREYALANNTVRVGDTVTDHLGSIQVQGIKFTRVGGNLPYCVYEGPELSVQGTIKIKKGCVRKVHQINLKSK